MEFQPFYDRVLVRPDIEETGSTHSSGLYVIEKTKQDVKYGTVVASGEGRLSPEGKLIANSSKAGDRIIFHIQDAIMYKADEKEKLAILRDEHIIAIIEE